MKGRWSVGRDGLQPKLPAASFRAGELAASTRQSSSRPSWIRKARSSYRCNSIQIRYPVYRSSAVDSDVICCYGRLLFRGSDPKSAPPVFNLTPTRMTRKKSTRQSTVRCVDNFPSMKKSALASSQPRVFLANLRKLQAEIPHLLLFLLILRFFSRFATF